MPDYAVSTGGRIYVARVTEDGAALQVSLDGQMVPVQLDPWVGSTYFRFTAGDRTGTAVIRRGGPELIVTLGEEQYRLRVEPAVPIVRKAATNASGAREVKAPMPGLVVSVEVAEGQIVEQGRAVAVMEAMKMQSEIRAPVRGKVTAVQVQAGQEVAGAAVLVVMEPTG